MRGSRTGLDGEKSGLWREFHRVISEIHPKWVVIENVPGLLHSNKGRDMGTILWHLEKLGYWWAYRVLNARYFGTPMERRRVFIVASLRGHCAGEVLFGEDEKLSALQREPSRRDTLPMLVGWDGGISYERLRQCIITKGRIRKLTPLEQERLMGFPDGWTDINNASDTVRYRALGNAVAVPVSKWIGNRILEIERGINL